ncbi:NAD(P)H-dependent oxidoreductase [Bordetella genomosp. 8]|nr:NAD(P)H-dependent oxidoreductase [Bordetella genomosp. 8]
MSILALTGSPSSRCLSSALTRRAAALLRERGQRVDILGVDNLPAEDLIQARHDGTAAAALRGWVEQADVVLLGAFARNDCLPCGLIAMLDLLDWPPRRGAFAGKIVVPLVTWTSGARLLAIEQNVKTVLSALHASHVLSGVYAADTQIRLNRRGNAELDGEIDRRLLGLVDEIIRIARPSRAAWDAVSRSAQTGFRGAVSHTPALARCAV